MTFWKAKDGTLINFEVHGDKPGLETLVLLPGLLGSIRTQWRSFVRSLEAGYRVVMVDIRGHGRSENKATSLDPELMVADLSGILDHLGADSVHLAGYSLGGYLGLMLHLNRPGLVTTLLMHATKFYWSDNAVSSMQKRLDPDNLSSQVPGYANQLAMEHGGTRWRLLVRQTADLIAYLAEHGMTEKMAMKAQCPVLVSVGDRDELVPVLEAQRLSRVLPNGSLLVLPKTHHPIQGLRPELLLPAMRLHLRLTR